MENGRAKLAHKIFVHRLIFNWIFSNGFNVYIKLIYISFLFSLDACNAAFVRIKRCFFVSLALPLLLAAFFLFHSIWRVNFAQSSPCYLLAPLPRSAAILFSLSSFFPSLSNSICLSLADSILVSFVLVTVFSRSTLFFSELSDPVFALSSAYLLKLL